VKIADTRIDTARIIVFAILSIMSVTYLLPLFWMASTSVKPSSEIFAWPPQWFPHPFEWSYYGLAFQAFPVIRYYMNTMIIAVLSVTGTLLSCVPAAYAFSLLRWRGRDALFFAYITTIMLPFQVQMIPLFILFKTFGWINTYLPLVVPQFFGNALYVFLLRQFFRSIPGELRDSAKIDGGGEFTILLKIVIPLAMPALAIVGLFTFLDSYSNFLGPLIYLNNSNLYTISIGLLMYQTEHSAEWQQMMAASLMSVAPVIVLFFLTQRTLVQGITLTGIKGVA
jgi:multiple sugar transport system permease protein